MNIAVTDVLPIRVTVHDPVPLHAPDHPANVEPELGAVVSVMVVPLAKLESHVCPQLIPEGLLVTVPDPVPPLCTVSWKLETRGIFAAPHPQRRSKRARHPRFATEL